MADINIIQQGSKVKYIVTSQNHTFDMETCDFYVEILYGMMGKKVIIPKSKFLYGTGGEFVMQVDTTEMVGKIVARMVWQQHDTDSDPDNERQHVDEQIIGFVVSTPNPQLLVCPKVDADGHDVRYELTDEPDIAAMYLRLVATETVIPEHGEPYTIYRPIITRNDEYIYVLREAADNLQNLINNNQ